MDLDLGNYERFVDVTLTRDNNITTGKIYQVPALTTIVCDARVFCLCYAGLLTVLAATVLVVPLESCIAAYCQLYVGLRAYTLTPSTLAASVSERKDAHKTGVRTV